MRILLAVAVLGVVACGDPTGPQSVAGQWKSAQIGPLVAVQFALTQDGGNVTGAWQSATTWGGAYHGTVTGSVSGDAVTLRMEAVTGCGLGAYIIEAERGDEMTGTAWEVRCSTGGKGEWSHAVTLSR